MITIRNKIINDLMILGYEKQEITNGIQNFNKRLLWKVNAICMIYSRKNKNWSNGQIIDVSVNKNVNEEWLTVKYNKKSKKKIQRFNKDVKPNDCHQDYNHKIVEFILNILKKHNTMDLDKHIQTSDAVNLSVLESAHSTPIQRLSSALKYYSFLDIIHNENDRNLFNNLIQRYNKLIDDFTILIKYNKQKLYDIQQTLIKNGDFIICDVKKCDFTARHANQSETEQTNSPLDPILEFYKTTMDSLHFYLFHIFDCGLRTIIADHIDEDDEIKQEKGEYFDAAFARVTKMISDRNHNTASFSRFRINNKFNMVVDTNNRASNVHSFSGKNSSTFMDELYSYLTIKNINNVVVDTFRNIILSEEYDSETMADDVIHINDAFNSCNIVSMLNHEKCFDWIEKFVKHAQKSVLSFRLGLRFYYWRYYKARKTLPAKEQYYWNSNDHGNYDICDLYVEKKYETFKEEIFNYKYISFKQYLDNVASKANIYMRADIVKQTKSMSTFLHYEINQGDLFGFNNLVSLILYTDFSSLCTDFSSTFRKITPYETLSAIKQRNRKYYWM
eukprot:20301_1